MGLKTIVERVRRKTVKIGKEDEVKRAEKVLGKTVSDDYLD